MTSIRSAGLRSAFPTAFAKRLILITAALFLAAFTTARAQDPPIPADDIPAHIAVVDGNAMLDRDAGTEPAQANVPLLAGDRLKTDRGRAEVLFGDGSALDLDEYTTVEFVSDSLMRLRAGRVRLSVARGTEAVDYRVDAASASVQIRTPGEYRLTVQDPRSSDPQVDVDVLLGSADVSNALGRTLVRAGMRASATSRAEPSAPVVAYDTQDEFDRWTDDQRDARTSSASARYLPDDLQYYGGSLDRAGSWGYEAGYGNVWYPRVASTWEPYYDGRWSYFGSFGWTWIGFDSWSWPTHHFGRWGLRQSRWFWIPDRRWSPAWVSWAYAPGFVSWCPLGFDNRAIFDVGFGGRGLDTRFGWNVIPSRSFVSNVIVSRNVVARPALSPAMWSQFSRRDSGPAWHGSIGSATPIRSPHFSGGRAIPRSSGGVMGGPPRDRSALPSQGRPFDTRSQPVGPVGGSTMTQPRRSSPDVQRGPASSGPPSWSGPSQTSGREYRRPSDPVTSQAPRSYAVERRSGGDGRGSVEHQPTQSSEAARPESHGSPRTGSGGGSSASGHGAPPSSSSTSSSSASASGRHAPSTGSSSGSSSGSRGGSGRRGGGR